LFSLHYELIIIIQTINQYKTMRFIFKLLLLFFCFILLGTKPIQKDIQKPDTIIKFITNYGEIVLMLYNDTPLHRDNFIKIVNDGVLDSVLFHRVIKNFMIQGGDTQSKNAQANDTLGNGYLPYMIPSEITPDLFHKKGVLAAARSDTPERVSSSTQFYIVQGKVLNDSLLDHAETRINGWLSEYYIKHDIKYKPQLDSLNNAIEKQDWETFSRLNNTFRTLAKAYTNFQPYKIPEAHREVYKTVGGTPHLDQNYTVFGEVISGLEVVDSIAAVVTNDLDRPIKDVRILSAKVIH
jgi:peptidyl-prolyl cis-trans isomerase B (cyclophilin B)